MSSPSPVALSPRRLQLPGPRPELGPLRGAYLELLKLSLCDLAGAGTQTITWTGDRRVFTRELSGEDQLQWRIDGRDWPENALTMTGLRRLDSLQACVESVVADGVPGDLIEAGAWRGGSSILMRATLDALGADDRTVWVADSFQGFPVPEEDHVAEDRKLETELGGLGYLAPTLQQVQGYFERFGVSQGVRFVPGFFEETMRPLRNHTWSVVRLDADTYKATLLTLDALYPSLSVGGYLISDDYSFLPACRRAIDEFRQAHDITEPIEQIDFNAIRWRRERGPASGESAAEPSPLPSPDTTPPSPGRTTLDRIPTDRELELQDELGQVRARLQAVEAELEAFRSSPLAGPADWARRRIRRPRG
jgi:O-methyltransferase